MLSLLLSLALAPAGPAPEISARSLVGTWEVWITDGGNIPREPYCRVTFRKDGTFFDTPAHGRTESAGAGRWKYLADDNRIFRRYSDGTFGWYVLKERRCAHELAAWCALLRRVR